MNVSHLAVGLFNATWQSAALILATAVGLRACRNVGARARCTLWSAVFFLSALLPIADLAMQRTLVVAPRGLEALPARAMAHYMPSSRRDGGTLVRIMPSATSASSVATRAFEPTATATASAQPRENPLLASQRALQSVAGALIVLYLLGVGFFGLRLARECFVLLALKRRCTILKDDPLSVGPLPRGAKLATSSEVEIPCVLGFIRPLIVLPADMLDGVSIADLRRVVGHEAAHLERYDDWANLLEQLVLSLFFYNPAMHFAIRQISTEREIACDDRVVMREGNTVNYAECLATLVHRASASRRLPVPGFHAGPRQIVVRIERLLDRAYSRSRRFGAGIAVTAGAVVLLAVTGVGNTVPVLTDAIAPAPPKVPAVPKLAAPAPKTIERIVILRTVPPAPEPRSAPEAMPPLRPSTQEVTVERLNRNAAGDLNAMYRAPLPAVSPLASMHVLPAIPAMPRALPQMRVMLEKTVAQNETDAQSYGALRRGDSLLDALSAMGYQKLSVDELVSLTDAGLTGSAIRAYARAFGHPSVDELRQLANRDISSTYVDRLRAAGLRNLTVNDAIRLSDHGVSADDVAKYVRTLHTTSVDDIIRLHESGVE
jgi:beta-lactamase regulating signal transducer with metallopeptidase domain